MTEEECFCLLLVNCLKEDKMKTSNFISKFGQSTSHGFDIVLQCLTACFSILLTLSPLVFQNPINYWYLPIIGIMLFTLFLTGINVWSSFRKMKKYPDTLNEDTDFFDHLSPVIFTQFAKQNVSNNKLFNTAA